MENLPTKHNLSRTTSIQNLLHPNTESSVHKVSDDGFSNVCRICATVTEFILPIFKGDGLQNELAKKINQHLPIKVCEDDRLPVVVCYQCASTLLAWHEMVQCCLQADTALKAQLACLENKQEQTETGSKKQITLDLQQDKYLESFCAEEGIAELVQTMEESFEEIADSGKATNSSSENPAKESSPEKVKVCEYCNDEYSLTVYKEHLVNAHSEFLFYCDECDTYVDRKKFLLHMSLHAVEYTNDGTIDNSESEIIRVSPNKSDKALDTSDKNDETLSKKCQNNEFSDHSDTDSFDPLPESVFEAIEDSQDSQQIDVSIEIDSPEVKKSNNSAEPTTQAEPRAKTKKHKKSRACPFCSKVYTAASSYFYHLKYYHRKCKEQECDVCGRKFNTKSCLMQHKTLHTGEKDMACFVCGKKFRTRSCLYIHEQTHTNVKNYSCDQCRKSFRWKAHLMRHQKRHMAHKAFVCAICSRGFAIRCDLLRHERTHKAGNFRCDQCGVGFAQLRYLKVHADKKHGNTRGASSVQT